jgi:hypoxanthine-DNA glycosylase
MGRMFDFEADLPYRSRVAALKRNRVALWDVCACAYRPGALDSAIVTATVRANKFTAFFAHHPHIGTVFFNGAKSAALYRRLVLPTLALRRPLEYFLLPSTSPAHASLSFDEKLKRWSRLRRATRG